MNFPDQYETIQVTKFYALLCELDDFEPFAHLHSEQRIKFSQDVRSLRGDFFRSYEILEQIEEFGSDDDFGDEMPSGYGHELSEDEDEEISLPSPQEFADLYASQIIKAIDSVPHYLAMKNELINLLSNIAPLCSDEHLLNSDIELYIQDNYSMKVYGKECKIAVNRCSNILEAILEESELPNADYLKLLHEEFSFEQFESLMTRSVVYLKHRLENLDALLKVYDGVDPIEYESSETTQEIQKYRELYERALVNYQDFAELINEVSTVLEWERNQMQEKFYDESKKQLCKLSDSLRIIHDYNYPSLRFAQSCLMNRNGRVPAKVDVIHATTALLDLFRNEKDITGDKIKIDGAYSVAEHVAFFLDLPDAVLEYFIDNDVLDQIIDGSADPSPLRRLVGENANRNSQRYEDFRMLSCKRHPEDLSSRIVDRSLTLTQLQIGEIEAKLDEVSIVYLFERIFPISDETPRPPQDFLNLN